MSLISEMKEHEVKIQTLQKIQKYLSPILENQLIKSYIHTLVLMNFDSTEFMTMYNFIHELMIKKVHKKLYTDMPPLRNILFFVIIYLKVYKHKYQNEYISPLQAYFLFYVVAHPQYLDILDVRSILSNNKILNEKEINQIFEKNIQLPDDIAEQMVAEQMVPRQKYFPSLFSKSKAAAIFSSLFSKSKAAAESGKVIAKKVDEKEEEEEEEEEKEEEEAVVVEAKGGKSRKRKSRRVKTRKMKERKSKKRKVSKSISKKRNNRKDISKRIKTTRKKI